MQSLHLTLRSLGLTIQSLNLTMQRLHTAPLGRDARRDALGCTETAVIRGLTVEARVAREHQQAGTRGGDEGPAAAADAAGAGAVRAPAEGGCSRRRGERE